MKRYINIVFGAIVAAVTIVGVSSCQRSFDDPEPLPIFTDQDILNDGYRIISINELKDYYYDEFGVNTIGKGLMITDKVAIRGKVISNDRFGNIYKSMYIQDVDGGENGAIEIKVGLTGLYNIYHVGRIVYVKADGLILGNYRFNLSLGGPSSDENYANSNIDIQAVINAHILRGQQSTLTAADTLVVNDFSELRDPQDLSRLVRFNNMNSKWGAGSGDGFSSTDIYPSFLESVTEDAITEYTNHIFTDVIAEWQAYEADPDNVERPTSPRPGLGDRVQRVPSWAFRNQNFSYYGSCLFIQGTKNYVVRTSGYARFALDPVPVDGTMADITAIFNKYSSRTGGYVKYQLLLNTVDDVEIQ